MDESQAESTARFLIGQRARNAVLTDALPDDFRPETLQDAIAIQMATMAVLGPIGGWKVGAADATAIPVASPLPASGIRNSPVVVASRTRASEAEISFRFSTALPLREELYTEAEVVAAIGTCHAAIEVVEPRFSNFEALDSLTVLADIGMHGGLAVGRPIDMWQPRMFATLAVLLALDGVKRKEAVGSNPGGSDLMRLLVWLANSEVVRAAGGIAAGAYVTTGSWTGLTKSPPGTYVTARFAGFPPVEVRFGAF